MFRRPQHLSCEEGRWACMAWRRHLEKNLIKALGTNKITEKIEPCMLLKCRVGRLDTVAINYTGKILAAYKKKRKRW